MIHNPVLPGFHPDPSVCRVGNDYYLVTSSFEFYPGIPLYHSVDLLEWELIGYCLTRPSQLPLDGAIPSSGLWAPTIRYHDGVFYVTTTNTTSGGNFYVTATDPRGEWSEPIYVAMDGIDPSFFFEDGRTYFSTNMEAEGKRGIAMAEIDVRTGRLLSEIRHLWGGTGGLAPEGAHLYRIGEYYYLMIAEGGTHYGHMETIARSASLWGPYESCPHNPILTNRNIVSPIQAVGHGDLVQTPDGDWRIVFLAIRDAWGMFHHLGRETFLLPVEWDADGWPHVGHDGTAGFSIDIPENEGREETFFSFADDFRGERLNLRWNCVRTPRRPFFEQTDEGLVLRSSGVSLQDLDCPAMLCTRQCHFDTHVTARMRFSPAGEGDRAGLVVYRNAWYFYELSVVRRGGENRLTLRKVLGDLDIVTHEEPVSGGELTLAVRSDRMHYEFGFAAEGGEMKWIGSGRTQFLSAEATEGVFTGVFYGLFAESGSRSGTCESLFPGFSYRQTAFDDKIR